MTDQLPLFDGSQVGVAADELGPQERDSRVLELTPRELALLLEYGYPFAEQEQQLRASRAVKGCHRVRIGSYWIELMLADLVRSAKEIRSRALLDELDALYSALEYALADHPKIHLR